MGQGTDTTKAEQSKRARAKLMEALRAVDKHWDHDSFHNNYPDYLPSFDEFVADMTAWVQTTGD